MKNRGLIIILIVVLFIVVEGKEIIGNPTKDITGDATKGLGLSITVIAPPGLVILSPKNQTYITNESILLNYSVTGNYDAVWYNLDKGVNTTIDSFITFNTSEGGHTFYLYANNSDGVREKTASFSVNTTLFIIYDDEFNEELRMGRNIRVKKKGNSTDFLDYTFLELQNLSDIILDNPEYGKISFNEAINLTDDENFSDNILDIDAYVNVSFNRIEINVTGLPNFNVSSTLWLYNLTFDNPRILKDGLICPSSICTKESYIGGVLKFNVTGFSVYSAEETSGEGGGGGGGGGIGNETCSDECSLGYSKIECLNSTTYKNESCGNYDLDPCLELNSVYSEIKQRVSSVGECVNNSREVYYKDEVCNNSHIEIINCGCVLFLEQGLNFISICENLGNSNIDHILDLIGENYQYILEWDNKEKRYKVWNINGTREISVLDKEKSYFVYYTGEPKTVELDGELFGDISLELLPGLNSPLYPYEVDSKEISGNMFYNHSFEYILDWDNIEKRFRVHNIEGTREFNKIGFGKGIFIFSQGGKLDYTAPNRTVYGINNI